MANPKSTTAAHQIMIIAALLAAALPVLAGQGPSPAPISPGVTAPSPALDCMTYLLNLSDCLTFVESGSNLTRPDRGCCPALSNLVDTQPICLCQLLGNPGQIGIPVDLSRALQLPAVCNVTTPPVSLCAAIGVPVGALAPSDDAPSPSPSDGGPVAASPSPGDRVGNGGPIQLACTHQLLIGLAFVFLASFF